MPLFMDVQTFGVGVHAGLLREASKGTAEFGVSCLRSWVSEPGRKVFSLIEAEDPDLLASPPRNVAGLVAREVYPVAERIHWYDPIT